MVSPYSQNPPQQIVPSLISLGDDDDDGIQHPKTLLAFSIGMINGKRTATATGRAFATFDEFTVLQFPGDFFILSG